MSFERQRPESHPLLPVPRPALTGRGAGATPPGPDRRDAGGTLPARRSGVVAQLPPRRPTAPGGRFGFLRTLRWRLALGFVAFLTVALVLLAGFLYLTIRPYLRGEALTRLEVDALKQTQNHKKDFESQVQVYTGEPTPAFEQTIGNALVGLADVQQVLLVDPRTEVVVSPGDQSGQLAPNFDRAALVRKVSSGVPSVSYRTPDGSQGIVLIGFSCQSCTALGKGGRTFVIEVISDFSAVNAVINRLMGYVALGMSALVVLAALVGIPLIRRALRPLTAMTATTQAIAAGNLSQRVNLPASGDEIGELSSSFDEMIDRIQAAFAAQRESEAHMRQFVADASHELRTPLTSLRGFTDVLLRGAKDDPEEAERVLRAMQRESERMSRLVHDLLTLARLDAGRQLHLQPFDLISLVGEAVDQARILAGQRLVTMRTDGGGPLVISADQDKIKQVLLILLDNALKYGRQGPDGWVRVQISRTPERAELLVTDNGQGIRPEDLPHIFERFYRSDKTRSRSGYTGQLPGMSGPASSTGVLRAMNAGGSGLGLPIALAIIQAHGGDIWAQSQWGQGTQFTIRLPRQPG